MIELLRLGIREKINVLNSRQKLTFLVQHSLDQQDQLLVFFTEDETVGIKPIRKYECI